MRGQPEQRPPGKCGAVGWRAEGDASSAYAGSVVPAVLEPARQLVEPAPGELPPLPPLPQLLLSPLLRCRLGRSSCEAMAPAEQQGVEGRGERGVLDAGCPKGAGAAAAAAAAAPADFPALEQTNSTELPLPSAG